MIPELTRACPALTSAHDNRDIRPMVTFVAGTPRETRPLCHGCRSVMVELGMDVREERRAADRPFTATRLWPERRAA